MTAIEFIHGAMDVAIIVLLSIVVLILRDLRDGQLTIIAQNRLQARLRQWVSDEHSDGPPYEGLGQ